MAWLSILVVLGLLALWAGVDSSAGAQASEEELLARYGVTWQPNDPGAYVEAAELAAARLAARAVAPPPARRSAAYRSAQQSQHH